MIYLDNAATTFPKPEIVNSTVIDVLTNGMGTPGRGSHQHSVRASGAVDAVRKAVSRFFGLLEDYRAIFTYSATDALNMAIKGFVNDGDRVVITSMEHNSVSRPLIKMALDKRITLEVVRCDSKGYIDLDELKTKARGARLAVINHASNVTGAIQPVAEIGRIVRGAGAYLLLDAAQTAGRVAINLEEMNIDMLAAAGHKGLYGLQGTGLLVLGSRVTGLRPFREGGTGFDSLSETQPVSWPEAFESGTHNVPGIMSIGAGLEFINSTGIETIEAAEIAHLKRLWDGLSERKNIRLYGPSPDEARLAVLSFNIDGWEPGDIGDMLTINHKISVRTGLHCAPLAHKTIGTHPEGTVRVSPGYFNTNKDIDSFIKATAMIADIEVPL